ELAVLTDAPRSATVRARRDSGLLGLSSAAFLELVDDAEFALALTKALAIQLQASRAVTLPSDPVPPVVALVSAGEGVASSPCADELATALGRWTGVKELGEEEAAEAASFGDALDRWERANGQVLLVVDSSARDEWTAFCMRQADRVVVVAD